MEVDVLLLTRDDCVFCEQARRAIERLGREFRVSLSLLDLNSPEGQALAARGGVLFPPGVFLNGEPFGYGRLSERKLRRELQRRVGRAE